MISKFKRSDLGMMAKFGFGTVSVNAYLLKKREGGQVELTTCKPRPIGTDLPKRGKPSFDVAKIVLDFKSVESLDVLIEKLTDLREAMADNGGNSSAV